MKSKPTVLILGARGFLGSAITAEATARDYRVFPVEPDNYRTHLGVEADWLINANGNSRKYLSDQQPLEDFDLSVRSVAASLQDFRADHYLYLSTVDVYADKGNPARNAEAEPIRPSRLSRYGHHKWLAEELIRFNASSWMVMRMGGLVGPGLRKNAVYDLLRGQPLRVHSDSVYQFLHTRETACVILDLAERGLWGETFNLSGEGVISVHDVADLIPGGRLLDSPPVGAPQRYEVSLEKINKHCAVTSTRETVTRFVKAVLEGREKLA
ncbi:MAG: sugar nucleotide-binding protein [Verrucomicrobia bacterium]|nr:sugar nucleotide-binding protein [Verrucomicrobiota bacterium]